MLCKEVSLYYLKKYLKYGELCIWQDGYDPDTIYHVRTIRKNLLDFVPKVPKTLFFTKNGNQRIIKQSESLEEVLEQALLELL